jgi:hypothetical protein
VRETYDKFGPIQIDVSMEKGECVAKVLVFPVSETGECKDIPDIPYEGRSDVDKLEALKRLAEKVGVDWSSVLGTAVNDGGN